MNIETKARAALLNWAEGRGQAVDCGNDLYDALREIVDSHNDIYEALRDLLRVEDMEKRKAIKEIMEII